MKKKASLNLSINAIVVLILAITMLGLGLTFMRNIFGGAAKEFTKVSGEVEKQMIEQAANMNFSLRIGNLIFAKLIELLWLYKSEPRLTDVGCTYRAIWKEVFYDIRDSLKGVGPEFSPEMRIYLPLSIMEILFILNLCLNIPLR